MNLCLFCLSLLDGMLVVFMSLACTYCVVRFFRPDLQTWWKYSVRIRVFGLVRALVLCSGCLTMIISVERCVCVFLPLRATSLIRTRTMAVIVFTTIATIQAICMIYPLKVQIPLQSFEIELLSLYFPPCVGVWMVVRLIIFFFLQIIKCQQE